MVLKKKQLPIAIVLICFMIFFTIFYASKRNYEFLIYVAVIVFFIALILVSSKKVQYPTYQLWLLTIWAMFHMSGGFVHIKGIRLYDIILIPLSKTYPIFKYDQFVHIFGFFVATLVVWTILKPHLKPKIKGWVALSIVIIMAGFGLGSLNEVIEFFATIIVKSTGVGGFINLSLDLVSNLIGAVLGFIFIRIKEK